jgi:DNA-binding IclR family transcriptional regulator
MPAQSTHRSLTLERGLRVLQVLGEHPDGLTVSQLAEQLGTHRAGIYRMLGPLADERYVIRRDDGRHTLGVGLLELASRVRPQLQEVAVPELRRLADEQRATTALTIRDGEEAVVAAVVEPRSTDMHIAYRTGLRHPIDVAASGLAILAGCAPRPGERREVREARRRGYARSTGELLIGAAGVAAPIVVGGRDPEASISVVWVDARADRAAALSVMRAARAVGAALR